jgi:hypothetical protein
VCVCVCVCERAVPGWALKLNPTGYPDHGRCGDLPLQDEGSKEEPGILWLVVRSSAHQATRLVCTAECHIERSNYGN